MSQQFPIPRTTRGPIVLIATEGQTEFEFPFWLFEAEDVEVRMRAETDVRYGDPLLLDTDYSVSGLNQNSGATITLTAPAAEGARVRLVGKRLPERRSSVVQGGSVRSVPLERELDLLNIVGQELRRDVDDQQMRALAVPEGQTAPPFNIADMIGGVVGVDAEGHFVKVPPGGAGTTADGILDATLLGKQVLRAPNGDAALGFLGAGAAGIGLLKQATMAAVIALLPAFIGSGVGHAKGLVPDPGSIAGTTRVLYEDSTWREPPLSSIYFDAVVNGGCDKTGLSDTSVAVQASITTAALTGRPCYFPAGIYNIGTSTITISAPNVRIVCDGGNTIFRRGSNVDAVAVKVEATATGLQWEGGRVSYAPAAHTVSGNHTGFWLEASNSSVTGLRVDGRFYIGFLITSAKNVTMSRCLSKGSVNRNFYCSYPFASGEVAVTFENCVADGAEAEGGITQYTNYGFNSNGFGTGSAQGFKYIGCLSRYQTFHGFATSERITGQQYIGCQAHSITGPGFLVQEANGFGGQRVLLSGCKAVACQSGFWVLNSYYTAMSGCAAQACTTAGFTLSGGQYCALTGCISENNTGDGFLMNNSTQASVGNTFTGCIAISNVGTGVIWGSGTTTSALAGCTALGNGANYNINTGTGHASAGNV